MSDEKLKQQIRDIIQDAYSEAWNHDHISAERTDEFVEVLREFWESSNGR